MRGFRAVLLLAFTLLGSFAFLAFRSDAAPGTLRIIVPGVWFREGGPSGCNQALIEMKDYFIVVDASFPSGASGALADVKRLSKKPVKYVFDTHHHGDHVYGNVLWTRAGATTIAFKGVADELKRLEPARWQASVKSREDVAGLKLDAPEPPKQEIKEALYLLNDGSRKVEFRTYGWGHTRGDGYVYLPKEQVLVTGDAVVNGAYNYTSDANIANWPVILRSVDKLKIKYVLPGHGETGGRDLVSGQALFLTELLKAVKAGVDQGRKVEEIQASLTLPHTVSNWVSDASLKRQVQDAYLEITQGKPRGDITP
jgi:cyclase